ncbi:hypothetical protein QVD17_19758 [Tagetes erecta]|uniref:Uncharacterized protein n=1 Tax=Tagetes erecta TaxID=13708 RepID=A0AAD8NXH6_TARER|nr:hypothetical protein QVD17_19758 [Tagetes erecta]
MTTNNTHQGTVYTGFSKLKRVTSFLRTTEVITNEAGVSVVRGNITRQLQITVSEESIRTALRFDEEEVGAPDEYTTAEC